MLLAVAAKAGKAVGRGAASARELVAAGLAPAALEQALQHGGEFASPPVQGGASGLGLRAGGLSGAGVRRRGRAESLVLIVYPSATLLDGRGANKGWLQELPDAATKIAWQSWVEVHPDTARASASRTATSSTVTSPHGRVEAPVYVYPGVRRDVVAMPIGQGHTAYGRNAKNRGVNPLDLLGADATDASGALAFCSTRVDAGQDRAQARLATTEGSARQLGRGIARAVSLAGARQGRDRGRARRRRSPTRSARPIAAAAASQRERAYIGDLRQAATRSGR